MHGPLASTIVVPDDAAPAVLTAARELRGALFRAGAPELPVVRTADAAGMSAFVVGAPPAGDAEPRAPDACRVARRGERLHLWGQGPRGALYAVTAYLQDVLGFRWLTADPEIVPPLEAPARLPDVDSEQRPSFAVRDVGYRERWRRRGARACGSTARLGLERRVRGRGAARPAGCERVPAAALAGRHDGDDRRSGGGVGGGHRQRGPRATAWTASQRGRVGRRPPAGSGRAPQAGRAGRTRKGCLGRFLRARHAKRRG